MKQVQQNPTVNNSFTISTFVFASTGASGTVNASGSVNLSSLTTGQSVFLGLGGATSGGFTKNGEYFVIPVSSGAIKLASTKTNAIQGVYISDGASGTTNAGSGTVYPNYAIGGTLYVGSSGSINIRGIENASTGTSSFSIHKNIGNSTLVPFMIKDISASGTTASDFVSWIQ